MSDPIAVVGIGCRLPGADGPKRLWELLCDGVDAIREVPPDRWDADALYDPDPSVPGRMNTRWGGFMDDIEGFDADFFRISQREAARMDPQQRIALEVAWEALEDAAVATGGLAGSETGVFMGVSTYDHGAALGRSQLEPEPYDGTGSALSIVANRISYALDLRGPSVVVDTACSSSLVAVHQACHALRAGEAGMAIAGGVNVITNPLIAVSFSKGGLMAPDGRCKTFDHRADGYVRSEGAAVVALKPLATALADGDRVYAVLLGSAVNQDGRTNGLTAPNRHAQEAVLRSAYRVAGVEPAAVDYVEAHGTGTAVGDPIEVGALASVLAPGRAPERPLRIGSVKSNLGHLEAAAGVTGLIKVALSLHHGRIPPSLHFEKPNPMLGLDRLPFQVQDRIGDWPEGAERRVAGVSSFGFGGSNSHVVMAAAPAPAEPRDVDAAERPRPFPVSARSESALPGRAAAWAELAEANAGGDPAWPARAAAAAALRGDHHPQRAAVVAATAAELAEGMRALADGEPAPSTCPPRAARRRRPRVVLVFPGQGSQWAGMGRRLAAADPAFRDAIRRCDAALERHLGHPLWSDDEGLVAEGTENVQPALFAIQVAIAETWRAWGLEPAAVVGHSMGEIAAAHVSGALSLEDAARVACERSRLLSEISGRGGLALVELDMDEATALVEGRGDELSVAAANGPRASVLTGTPGALDGVIAELEERGVFARRIAVEFAAHSPEVVPLQPRLRAAIEGIAPRAEAIPVYSTVTGEPIGGEELGAGYWETNLRQTVLFARAVDRLLADRHDAFVEVAPHPVLARSLSEIARAADREAAVVASMRRDEDELRGMLVALGDLYTFGVRVDWAALHPAGADHVELPPHGWERRRFPLAGGDTVVSHGPARIRSHPRDERRDDRLIGSRIGIGAVPELRLWSLPLDLRAAPELADHMVEDVPLVPGAYWLTAAAEAAAESSAANGTVVLEDVSFAAPCVLREGHEPDLQLAVRPGDGGTERFTIGSTAADARAVVHAEGAVRARAGVEAPSAASLDELAAHCAEPVSIAEQYERLEGFGLRYGARFRGLVELRAGEREALGRVRLPEGLERDGHAIHPALLDSCLHTVAAAAAAADLPRGLPLPAGVGRVWARHGAAPLREGWCHARVREADAGEVIADVVILDDAGAPVWSAAELRVRIVPPRRAPEDGGLYELRLHRADAGRASSRTGGWLVLAGDASAGETLRLRLAGGGNRCEVACDPSAGDLDELLAGCDAWEGGLRGVIDARAVPGPEEEPDGDGLALAAERTLALVQAMARRDWSGAAPHLWLLTLTARAGAAGALAGAGVAGLGRVAANELPEQGCSLAEVEWPLSDRDLAALESALRADDPPVEVTVRAGELLAPALAPLGHSAALPPRPRADRTYLITGALGAIGLRLARRLVGRGARHLLLIGRSAPSAEAESELETLRSAGAKVRFERADVGSRAAVDAALGGLGSEYPPLAGVFHAAGVLEDAPLAELATDGLRRALGGKALGAWNLHQATAGQPVEQFVLFASLAGLLGSPGQAAYASANSFLDALARHRADRGLPALSVDFGPWAGSGLAVAGGGIEWLTAAGLPPLEPDAGIELLEQAIATGKSQVTAAGFDRDRLRRALVAPAARQLLEGLVPSTGDASAERGAAREAVLAHTTARERLDAMRRFLVEQVAAVLRLPADDVDPRIPFEDLGFDSLMAIELRDRLELALDTRLSATLSFAHPTAEALAEGLLELLAGEDGAAADGGPQRRFEREPEAEQDDDLSELDDDELAALVAEELER